LQRDVFAVLPAIHGLDRHARRGRGGRVVARREMLMLQEESDWHDRPADARAFEFSGERALTVLWFLGFAPTASSGDMNYCASRKICRTPRGMDRSCDPPPGAEGKESAWKATLIPTRWKRSHKIIPWPSGCSCPSPLRACAASRRIRSPFCM